MALSEGGRGGRLAVAAGVGYLGSTGALLVQALRGQPLFAPDGATWLSLALVAGIALAVAGTGRRQNVGAVAGQLGHPPAQERALA